MSQHEPPCRAELEQRRLVFLNALAANTQKWRPGADDGKCLFCGFRPRPAGAALCEPCEQRRQLLTTRYPEIRVEKMQHLGTMTREWMPYSGE